MPVNGSPKKGPPGKIRIIHFVLLALRSLTAFPGGPPQPLPRLPPDPVGFLLENGALPRVCRLLFPKRALTGYPVRLYPSPNNTPARSVHKVMPPQHPANATSGPRLHPAAGNGLQASASPAPTSEGSYPDGPRAELPGQGPGSRLHRLGRNRPLLGRGRRQSPRLPAGARRGGLLTVGQPRRPDAGPGGLCPRTAGLPGTRLLPAGTLASGVFPSAQGCPSGWGNELPQALAFTAVRARKIVSLGRGSKRPLSG